MGASGGLPRHFSAFQRDFRGIGGLQYISISEAFLDVSGDHIGLQMTLEEFKGRLWWLLRGFLRGFKAFQSISVDFRNFQGVKGVFSRV